LPYPLPTEPIAAGADAIKNLATAIDPAVLIMGGPTADSGIAAATWTTLSGPPAALARGIGYDPVTGVTTIQQTGTYRIDATAAFNAAGAGDRLIRVALNGVVDPVNTLVTNIAPSASLLTVLRTSIVKQLAVGDTLRLQVFTATVATLRGSINTGWGSGMSVARVAP
jgi:predicted NBD/HSP70 family sugar kinase